MSRTSKTLRRLGVPSLAAATLVAGIPAFLGSAQAAPGDTLTLSPKSQTGAAGACRSFTVTVKDVNGNNRNTVVTVDLTERVAAGQASTEQLDVAFCTPDDGEAAIPGTTSASNSQIANDTDRAQFSTGNDGSVTFGLTGVPSTSTRDDLGTVDIVAFQDDNLNGAAGSAEAQDSGTFTVTDGGTPIAAGTPNLFQPSDTFTANNAVTSLTATSPTGTFFPGETVTVPVVLKNAAGDLVAGAKPSSDITAGNNNAAPSNCTVSGNDGVSVCSYTARTSPEPFLGNDTIVIWVNKYFDGPASGTANENTLAPDANEPQQTVTRTIAARPLGTSLDLTVGDANSARTSPEQTFQLPQTGATEVFNALVTSGDANTPVGGVIVRFTIEGVDDPANGSETFGTNGRQVDVTTDASGIARATVNDTRGVEGETIRVTAVVRGQVGAVQDDSQVTFRTIASNSASTIDLSPATTTTQAGGFREFTATARAGTGELVVGATVTVTVDGVGRLANGARQAQFTTTSNGTVRFETTSSSTESGTQTVTATLVGTTNGTTQSRTDSSTNTITATAPSASPSATPTASQSATPAPSGSATPAPATPIRLSVQNDTITPGVQGIINLTGAPSAVVELLAYSRPSTTYGVVRTISLGTDGTAVARILPGTNTRLYARYAGVANSDSPSVVQNVATALSLTVVRNGTRNYTFQGRILPRRAGQLITLYRVDQGREIITQQIKTDNTGTYYINRRFTGSGTFGFLTRTGQNLTNVAGVSNNGQPRPTAIF